MIDRAETWLEFIETRNNSVHDYFEVPEQQYVLLAQNFLKKSRRLFG
jgi:uncharacterized protein with HEPN domain